MPREHRIRRQILECGCIFARIEHAIMGARVSLPAMSAQREGCSRPFHGLLFN